MTTHLRYISISHSTASVAARQAFHFPEAERERFIRNLKRAFPDLRGLLLLVTCNRTELFAETDTTPAAALRDYLIHDRVGREVTSAGQLFTCKDDTQESVTHLLRVSAGLESAVLGDAEIIHQIKKAYHLALEEGLQGSLLERAMQSVFRFHKRISNETLFRDGTTSTAYQTLKLLRQAFGPEAEHKRILVVGAGDIVRQLLKYNEKFGYRELYLTNRTASRAARLAASNKVHTFPWNRMLEGDLESFDAIIGAASHCPGLISGGWNKTKPVVLIDLAVPHNIAIPEGSQASNVSAYDLDAISKRLQEHRQQRREAVEAVEEILRASVAEFGAWHADAPRRAKLRDRKKHIHREVETYLQELGLNPAPEQVRLASDRLLRKWRALPEAEKRENDLASLLEEHQDLVLCS